VSKPTLSCGFPDFAFAGIVTTVASSSLLTHQSTESRKRDLRSAAQRPKSPDLASLRAKVGAVSQSIVRSRRYLCDYSKNLLLKEVVLEQLIDTRIASY
jgi:hypothetical protein